MSRRRLVTAAAAIAVLFVVLGIVLTRQRLRRNPHFRVAGGEQQPSAPERIPPIERWTEVFERLESDDLADLLEEIEAKQPDHYRRFDLAWLHARVLIESGDESEALTKLQPYLKPGHRFRDMALYHQAEIEEARNEAQAARAARMALIAEYPESLYRDQAIEEEIEFLASRGDLQSLNALAGKIAAAAGSRTSRDISARIVEAELRAGRATEAVTRAAGLLRGGTTDDAADRVARAIDKPELIRQLNADSLFNLGETFRNHRRFDRAVVVLGAALPLLPQRRDDIQFAIGRSWYGNERFAEAQQAYLQGAAGAKTDLMKATFFLHASRAAQLRGDDATAERLMTSAIAVKGRFPATTAALTQRIRTRVRQKRVAEATADLAMLRKMAPDDPAVVEASLAYAVGVAGLGNRGAALRTLNEVAPKLLSKYDAAEFTYWRARWTQASDPRGSVRGYLAVMKSAAGAPFAYFAREHLAAPALAPHVAEETRTRDAQVTNLIDAKQYDAAHVVQTERVLLSSKDRPRALARLKEIYRELPAYQAILEVSPKALPRFPNVDPGDRTALLMAMGLFDEAVPEVLTRYPLTPLSSALTQATALNRGGASRQSIHAAEVLMRSVPDDFAPELLPTALRQLLYPRYFLDYILEDAKKYDADPQLVLAIMREESRFNPRAKSAAAARGLLQFIITTARDIGREVGLVDLTPEDLYDPRIVIRLGARYIGELSKQFGGDRYRAVAAYNAGPHQVQLWSRLTTAPGNDYFVSAINFDETKHYVRKVMGSYEAYGEIYK